LREAIVVFNPSVRVLLACGRLRMREVVSLSVALMNARTSSSRPPTSAGGAADEAGVADGRASNVVAEDFGALDALVRARLVRAREGRWVSRAQRRADRRRGERAEPLHDGVERVV
jgi:hypothetical protein